MREWFDWNTRGLWAMNLSTTWTSLAATSATRRFLVANDQETHPSISCAGGYLVGFTIDRDQLGVQA